MAIEEKIAAEERLGLLDEPAQRLVIGSIEALDPSLHLPEVQLLGVDLLAAGDNPGDRAEP